MTEPAVIDRWDGGFGWIAHPDELLRRASHGILGDRGVWLVDPVDWTGLDDLLQSHGPVAGVVVTIDRHTRDADTLAQRHDVAVHVPTEIGRAAAEIHARTETAAAFAEDTGFHVRKAIELPLWREVALYQPDDGTLIVGDALGTAPYFSPANERLSVYPLLRPMPPRTAYSGLAPERVLVGHGKGVMEDGDQALEQALNRSRRNIPQAYLNSLNHVVRSLFAR